MNLALVPYTLGMVMMLGCWVTGMVNYSALAKQAGLGFWRTWYSFDVYKYAFTTARGSRETKLMVGGFLGMFVSLLVAVAGAAVVAQMRKRGG